MYATTENDPKSRWEAFRRYQESCKDPVQQARRYLSAVQAQSGQEQFRQRCGLALRLVHGFALASEDVVDLLHEWECDQELVPKTKRIVDAVHWAEKKTYDGERGDRLR